MKYPKITLTCTSGRRHALFERTFDSFMANCKDQDLIERWIVSDDGSTEGEFEAMQERYPHIEFHRSPKQGQPASLNFLFSEVQTDWFFHMEDDWEFIKPGRFIRKLFDIAACEKMVLAPTLRKWKPLKPEYLKKTRGGTWYVMHKYQPGLDDDTIAATDSSWFGWSLNPGLQYKPLMDEFGPFEETDKPTTRFWDRPHAQKYHTLGYRRANIYDNYIRHIGDESLYSILRSECQRRHNCPDYPLQCERCER
jgi:glycosyltransferase involved in cell wall biosynthesis